MVIMEALAAGRPVISTYVAGIPELVRPGESGWLVPAANIEALAAAMIECLDMPASRLAGMAAEGGAATRARHSTRTEGDRLEAQFLRCARIDGPADAPRSGLSGRAGSR